MQLLFTNLPGEVTFVDENDIIRFYSTHPSPIFSRTKDIIGTSVIDCHSEESHNAVRVMLDDFRENRRSTGETRIVKDGRNILVTYIALRDENGNYRGMFEFTQDVTDLKEISGER
jgi:hypothetical protein